MGSYRELVAWQKAMDLAEAVYRATNSFPAEERYGLTSQMRRSAVAIPSDLAEGSGRLTTRDWQRFLAEARGSGFELETQLILSRRLSFGDGRAIGSCLAQAEEVGRIINGLLASTRSRTPRKNY